MVEWVNPARTAGPTFSKAVPVFTQNEVAYLASQPLARIATVAPDGQPDVTPVSFEVEGGVLYVGSRFDVTRTRKYQNVVAGHEAVALVVDDFKPGQRPEPRGIRVYGTAQVVERDGKVGHGKYLQITPRVSWSWNVEGPAFVDGAFAPHKTVHRHG